MAERVTDLRDIERRVVAHLVGEPEPGVPTPDASRRCSWPRTSPRPTPRASTPQLVVALVTERGGADQPHRDHRPPARHPVRGRRRRRAGGRAPATCVLVDGERRHRRDRRRTPTRPRARVAADREARAALASWTGPAATADGIPVKLLANVADGASAASGGARRRSRASGLFRTELCFLDRKDEPIGRGAGRDLRRRARAVRRRPVRRGPHPRRRLRQADRLRHPRGRGEPRPRRARPAARPSATPACWTASSTASPPRPSATGTETWVMAPMVATVAEADRVRRPGARARAQGRRDGRDPERRAARAPDARGRRLPLDRHQRPDPVHDGGRPDGHRPGPPDRPLAAGGAPADRDHRRGRAAGRQAGRRLRRGRRRPAARLRAGRHGHHVAVDGRAPPSGRSAPGSPRSRWTPARTPPRPRSAAADPMAARDAVRAVLGV